MQYSKMIQKITSLVKQHWTSRNHTAYLSLSTFSCFWLIRESANQPCQMQLMYSMSVCNVMHYNFFHDISYEYDNWIEFPHFLLEPCVIFQRAVPHVPLPPDVCTDVWDANVSGTDEHPHRGFLPKKRVNIKQHHLSKLPPIYSNRNMHGKKNISNHLNLNIFHQMIPPPPIYSHPPKKISNKP